MQKPDALFVGVTNRFGRDVVADVWAKDRQPRVILPCVGGYAAALALRGRGAASKGMEASDLNLVSSVVGYLADPTKSIDELPVDWSAAAAYTEGTEDEPVLRAAGLLVASHACGVTTASLYKAEFKADIRHNLPTYRRHVAGQLEKLLGVLGPISYEVADVRRVIEQIADSGSDTFAYFNLPGYAGGYGRLFGRAELALRWDGVTGAELRPDEAPGIFARLAESDALCLTYISTQGGRVNLDAATAAGWVRVGAKEVRRGRTDYVLANRDPARRYVDRPQIKAPDKYPIFADHDITPETQVRILSVTAETCLYYRDLFVHKMGTTAATSYHLLLLDGRVTTAFGLEPRRVRLAQTRHLGEVFGISVSSLRYERLGKLFMALLTSGDMHRWLLARYPDFTSLGLEGISTSSLTTKSEGKTDRGIARLVHRERHGEGYRVQYVADFRDDTWPEAIEWWLGKFGHKHREGYSCPEGPACPGAAPPAPTPKKEKRQRGPRREAPTETIS